MVPATRPIICLTERSRAGWPICPRKYFWATMLVAFCDQLVGNSTSFCSKATRSPWPMRASRSSHSAASKGCTPGEVKKRVTGSAWEKRFTGSASAGAASWGVVVWGAWFIGLPFLLRRRRGRLLEAGRGPDILPLEADGKARGRSGAGPSILEEFRPQNGPLESIGALILEDFPTFPGPPQSPA